MTISPVSENMRPDSAPRPSMSLAGRLFLGLSLIAVGGVFVAIGYVMVRETGKKAQMWNAVDAVCNKLRADSSLKPLLWEVHDGALFVRDTSTSSLRPVLKPEEGQARFMWFVPVPNTKPEPNGGCDQSYVFSIDENNGTPPAKPRMFVVRKWIYQ